MWFCGDLDDNVSSAKDGVKLEKFQKKAKTLSGAYFELRTCEVKPFILCWDNGYQLVGAEKLAVINERSASSVR